MNRRLTFPLIALAILVLSPALSARTWTDSQGNQINAKFVRVHGADAVLLQGKKVITVPLGNLSSEDQDYVRQQGGGGGRAAARGSRDTGSKTPGLSRIGPPAASAGTEDAPVHSDSAESEPMRTWTDVRGNTLSASFVRVSGNDVVLQAADGEKSFPYSGFSSSDQTYIRDVLKRQGREHLIPKTTGRLPNRSAGYGMSMPPGYGSGYDEDEEDEEEYSGEDEEAYSDEDEEDEDGGEQYDSGNPGGRYPQQYGSPGSGSFPGHRPPMMSGPMGSGGPPGYEDYEEEHEDEDDGEDYGGGFDMSSPGGGFEGPQYQWVQYCTNCKAELPESIGAGDRCPKCNAYFDYEENADGSVTDASGKRMSKNQMKRRVGPGAIGGGVIGGAIAVLIALVRALRR